MKFLAVLFIVFNFICSIIYAQEITYTDLTIHLENISSDKGKLYIGLYNSEKDFLKSTFKGTISNIDVSKGVAKFNVPYGVYAVSIYHDENDNGKLDTNFMGIPKEDYGCSNNAKGFMGAPKWEDAKFELNSSKKTITIML